MRFHLEATSFGRLKGKITQAVAKNTEHLIKLRSIDMLKYFLQIVFIRKSGYSYKEKSIRLSI